MARSTGRPVEASGRHGGQAAEARLDPSGELRGALGRAPEAGEVELFAAMPTERRAAALARIGVLRRWTEQPGEMTAAEAAVEADVAVSRFYEIAAAWKASPTLASVGTFAKRPGRRGPRLVGEVVNTIQSLLPGLVGEAGKSAKVAAVVNALVAHPRLKGAELPHVNTLRTMVERERRRQRAEELVGGRPGLDASACELLRQDGRYHVVFAVVDRTSRLILGFSVGEVGDSRGAYARAARDALARITAPDAPRLPWADATERLDVIAGDDGDAWAIAKERLRTDRLVKDMTVVSTGRRYGRYFKLVAGGAIGELRLFPARTDTGAVADVGLKYDDVDAITAIEVEVSRHNAAVMAESAAEGAERPAPATLRLLEKLAEV